MYLLSYHNISVSIGSALLFPNQNIPQEEHNTDTTHCSPWTNRINKLGLNCTNCYISVNTLGWSGGGLWRVELIKLQTILSSMNFKFDGWPTSVCYPWVTHWMTHSVSHSVVPSAFHYWTRVTKSGCQVSQRPPKSVNPWGQTDRQ